MAENIFVCKHLKGAGYCTLYEDYCHEGPCGDSTPVEYSPVVHGRWIHTKIEDDDWGGTFHSWKCSACGYSAGHNPTGTNYCPNCGAKMDGE